MKRQPETFLAECTFLVIFASALYADPTNMLSNGGFETALTTPRGRPFAFGYWEGDVCEIVTASPGISPLEGDRMLQFMYSDVGGPSAYWTASDLWQLVDMGLFSDPISKGMAIAVLSAYFNRVFGDNETDTQFSILIFAFAGQPSTWLSQYHQQQYLAGTSATLYADGDPSTWENLTVDLLMPIGTDFIAVDILAAENIFNDGVGIEFDGHYADAVSLTITVIPAPGADVLGGIGIAFSGWLLRRRRTL